MKIELSADDVAVYLKERAEHRIAGKPHGGDKGEFGRRMRKARQEALATHGVRLKTKGERTGAIRMRETPEVVNMVASMRRAGKAWTAIVKATDLKLARCQAVYTQWLEDQMGMK